MDTLTTKQRSYNMSLIRSRSTKPERSVRSWLWHHGYRYRLNVNNIPGRPDIVLRKYRTAIFVNGCFWHGHEKCNKFSVPKSNTKFWIDKITRNKERDQRNYMDLYESGWSVIVIWECQLTQKKIDNTMRGVEHMINSNLLSIYKKG